MKTIHTVLATVKYDKEKQEQLKQAFAPASVYFVDKQEEGKISEVLKTADVAILGSDITDQILREGETLRWIHCDHAGLNASAKPEVFERGIVLSGSAGRSGPVLAQHTFFLILSLVYDSHGLLKQQEQCMWGGIPGYSNRRGLFGKTIGIIGMGYTGKEVAKVAKAFGMTVLGYERTHREELDYVDKIYTKELGDDIEELLKLSDVIVLSVKLSDETYHLIDRKAFSMMKSSAYLINMARGAVIDEEALADALKSGQIAGAGCDTFEVEPLPEDSPLWKLSNMVITPHCTPEMPDLAARSMEIICKNIELYRKEMPLMNQLSIRDVYTHNCR